MPTPRQARARGLKCLASHTKNVDAMIVKLVEIGEIPHEVLKELILRIKDAFTPLIDCCIKGVSLGIPPRAFNAHRKQYDADVILERLIHRVADDKLLGIVAVDLYTSSRDLNFIFGQAQYPGKAALVSLCRLDPVFYGKKPDFKLFLRRATKESIHELGHIFGLGHCPDPGCVMSFSNSIFDVDKKSSALCSTCRAKLFC